MRIYALLFSIYALLMLAVIVPYAMTIVTVAHRIP